MGEVGLVIAGRQGSDYGQVALPRAITFTKYAGSPRCPASAYDARATECAAAFAARRTAPKGGLELRNLRPAIRWN
jgi:hypothetical protein